MTRTAIRAHVRPATILMACLSALLLATAFAGPALADSPNVTKHTKAEIIDYLAKSGASINDVATYDVEPVPNTVMGNLSAETKQSALAMLNNVRYIAGLNPVKLDDEYGRLAQAAAFADNAVSDLTHTPGDDNHTRPSDIPDDLWNLGIRGAGSTNIAWGLSLNGAIRNGWMADDDASNIDRIGHRRWCLNPTMGSTGFGRVNNYTAMYSFDRSGSGTQSNVVWPAQVMPVEYFKSTYPWSISVGMSIANEGAVKVTLTNKGDGTTWVFDTLSTTTSSNRTSSYFKINNVSYGASGCIIFRPENFSFSAGDIFHVKAEGVNGKTIEYDVEFFSGYPVESISFAEDVNYLSYSSLSLRPTAQPADAAGYGIEWSSSDESVATVSASGVLTKVAPGETTITATVPGQYTKSGNPISASTKVVVPKSIYVVDVSFDTSSLEYTGEAIRPVVTVVDPENGKQLVEGEDYTLSFDEVVEPGERTTVWIYGQNAYTNGVGRYVTVLKRTIKESMISLSPEVFTYTGSSQQPQANVSFNGMTLAAGSDYTVTVPTAIGEGEYTVKIVGSGDHYRGTVSRVFTIEPKELEDSMLDMGETTLAYNEEKQVPEFSLTYNDMQLVEGTDYKVSVSGDATSAGSYTLEIGGIGNYQGSLTREYVIEPTAVAVKDDKDVVAVGLSCMARR